MSRDVRAQRVLPTFHLPPRQARRVDLELGGAESVAVEDGTVTTFHTELLRRLDHLRAELATDSAAAHILRDYQSTPTPFLVTPGGTATAVDVPVSRGD